MIADRSFSRRTLALAFFSGALTAAIACGQGAPAAPSMTVGTTVYAQSAPSGPAFSFPSGAGMSEQGDWLFIRGRSTTSYGPVGIAGTVHLTTLQGSGTRFLCVDASNGIYASEKPCRQ